MRAAHVAPGTCLWKAAYEGVSPAQSRSSAASCTWSQRIRRVAAPVSSVSALQQLPLFASCVCPL